MTTSFQETAAGCGKTIIRFCGTEYTLETLNNEAFEELYQEVIDRGADLLDQAATWPLSVLAQRKTAHEQAVALNSSHLLLLDREANRRKTLPASTGPQLCPDCSQLSQPIDPNELCEDCVEVCNDFEGDRYIEPEFTAA